VQNPHDRKLAPGLLLVQLDLRTLPTHFARPMLTIRPYRKGDLAALVELVRELQAHEIALYERMKPVEDIGAWYVKAIKRQCDKHAGTMIVAELDGKVVGYATVLTDVLEDSLDEVAFSHAHVEDLVTGAEFRGRGIGKALLAECERYAREAGRDEIRIGVLAGNRRAHAVYERAGFGDHLVTMRKKIR
jgi:ribosomal protein S18 acetylase RimI-like enzyme